VRELVRTGDMPSCLSEAQALVRAHPQFRFKPYPGRASGYIVDTVQTVLHAFFSHDDFAQCLIVAVNRGDDADTTGALTGMLAGARCGAILLPSRWLDRVDRGIVRRITHQTAALLAIQQVPRRYANSRWSETRHGPLLFR